jgi:hypothetical protein
MAQGFIVVQINDQGTPTAYWNGTAFVEEIDSSDFMETKPEARYVQGSTQAADTSVDIVVKAAESNIELLP